MLLVLRLSLKRLKISPIAKFNVVKISLRSIRFVGEAAVVRLAHYKVVCIPQKLRVLPVFLLIIVNKLLFNILIFLIITVRHIRNKILKQTHRLL